MNPPASKRRKLSGGDKGNPPKQTSILDRKLKFVRIPDFQPVRNIPTPEVGKYYYFRHYFDLPRRIGRVDATTEKPHEYKVTLFTKMSSLAVLGSAAKDPMLANALVEDELLITVNQDSDWQVPSNLEELAVKPFAPTDLLEALDWVRQEAAATFIDGQTLRVLDLFAGTGGLSFGLAQKGMDIVAAIEHSKEAAENYFANHPLTKVFNSDIKLLRLAFKQLVQYSGEPGLEKAFSENPLPWLRCMDRPKFDEVPAEIIKVDPNSMVAVYTVIGSDQERQDHISRISYSDAWHRWKLKNSESWAQIRNILKFGGNVDPDGDEEVTDLGEDDVSVGDQTCEVSSGATPQDFHIVDFSTRVPGHPLCVRADMNLPTQSSQSRAWIPIHQVSEKSIREFVQRNMEAWPLPGNIDVVVGGPPCQDFSLANPHRISTTWWGRNRLVQEWLEWIRIIKPRYAVMENVEGILKCEEPKMVMAQLLCWGYQVAIQVISATSYGILQHRKRVLIIAALHGEELPLLRSPTHHTQNRAHHSPLPADILKVWNSAHVPEVVHDKPPAKDLEHKTRPCATVRDALNDLPIGPASLPTGELPYRKAVKHRYQKFMRDGSDDVVRGHVLPPHSESAPVDGIMLNEDDQAPTVTTSGSKVMHYRHPRPLTIREFARIQSFPDVFVFNTTRPQEARRLIGNAVPPLLGREIGHSIMASHFAKHAFSAAYWANASSFPVSNVSHPSALSGVSVLSYPRYSDATRSENVELTQRNIVTDANAPPSRSTRAARRGAAAQGKQTVKVLNLWNKDDHNQADEDDARDSPIDATFESSAEAPRRRAGAPTREDTRPIDMNDVSIHNTPSGCSSSWSSSMSASSFAETSSQSGRPSTQEPSQPSEIEIQEDPSQTYLLQADVERGPYTQAHHRVTQDSQ